MTILKVTPVLTCVPGLMALKVDSHTSKADWVLADNIASTDETPVCGGNEDIPSPK